MIGGGQLTMKSRFDRGNNTHEIMIDPQVAEPQILFIEVFLIAPLQTHVTFKRIEIEQRDWSQTKAFML